VVYQAYGLTINDKTGQEIYQTEVTWSNTTYEKQDDLYRN